MFVNISYLCRSSEVLIYAISKLKPLYEKKTKINNFEVPLNPSDTNLPLFQKPFMRKRTMLCCCVFGIRVVELKIVFLVRKLPDTHKKYRFCTQSHYTPDTFQETTVTGKETFTFQEEILNSRIGHLPTCNRILDGNICRLKQRQTKPGIF